MIRAVLRRIACAIGLHDWDLEFPFDDGPVEIRLRGLERCKKCNKKGDWV